MKPPILTPAQRDEVLGDTPHNRPSEQAGNDAAFIIDAVTEMVRTNPLRLHFLRLWIEAHA